MWTDEFDSDNDSDDEFEEDIFIVVGEGKMMMRALLDTGMVVNMISAEKAAETGLNIIPYTGDELHDVDGPSLTPIGQIEAQFHFRRQWQTAKTWRVPFVIIEDPPFDVAFGRTFLRMSRLVKKNTVALPVRFSKPTTGIEIDQIQSART